MNQASGVPGHHPLIILTLLTFIPLLLPISGHQMFENVRPILSFRPFRLLTETGNPFPHFIVRHLGIPYTQSVAKTMPLVAGVGDEHLVLDLLLRLYLRIPGLLILGMLPLSPRRLDRATF